MLRRARPTTETSGPLQQAMNVGRIRKQVPLRVTESIVMPTGGGNDSGLLEALTDTYDGAAVAGGTIYESNRAA